METLWKSTRKLLFVVIVGILVYEFCENFEPIQKAVGNFFSILQPLFIGIVIAFIANMPMRFLENRIFAKWKDCGLKRGVCMALALIFVISIITVMLLLVVPRIVDSLVSIFNDFDTYTQELSVWAADLWDRLKLNEQVEQIIQRGFSSAIGRLDDILLTTATTVLEGAVSVAGLLANLLIAFIMSIYALYSKEKFLRQSRKLVRAIFPEQNALRILEICTRTNQALNSYVYGMIIDCFMLGILCFIGMSILNFPHALLISTIIGFTQIVPIVGPWLGAIIGAFLILFVDPPKALWFIIMLLIVQQIDNNLIYPRVVGNAVGLSGIWVLIAILLGGGLWGLGGIVLAVPLMAVCYTTVGEWVNKRLEEKRC